MSNEPTTDKDVWGAACWIVLVMVLLFVLAMMVVEPEFERLNSKLDHITRCVEGKK